MPSSTDNTARDLTQVVLQAKESAKRALLEIGSVIGTWASIGTGEWAMNFMASSRSSQFASFFASHQFITPLAETAFLLAGLHYMAHHVNERFLTHHAVDYLATVHGILPSHVTKAHLETLTSIDYANIRQDLASRGIQPPALGKLCKDVSAAWSRDGIATGLLSATPAMATILAASTPAAPFHSWAMNASAPFAAYLLGMAAAVTRTANKTEKLTASTRSSTTV